MTSIEKKVIEDATTEFTNQYFEKIKKLGYSLSIGFKNKENQETIIIANAQYTSWKRQFNEFGTEKLQEEIYKILPKKFEYQGIIYEVEPIISSIGKLL